MDDVAFATLADEGVTTVVSVDGARPRVELARKHRLRYVHVPIGYDGLSRDAELALVRVMQKTTGSVYIHCHHGKHRGPAAAAVACLAEGSVDRAGAVHILEVAGTAESYRGLWHDVQAFELPSAEEQLPDLVEIAEVDGMVEAMANIAIATEHLHDLAGNDWVPLADRPDVEAQQAALLLWEGFREAKRFSEKEDEPKIQAALAAAEQQASRLRKIIESGETASAARALAALEASCKTCHARHRDNR